MQKQSTNFTYYNINKEEMEIIKEQGLYRTNLKLIKAESILTSVSAAFSVPIITVFWNSLGMNQAEIGLVQMIFTIVVLFLDVPMGYVADRFNRKFVNVVGDFACAIGFAVYMVSQNIYTVIIAECILGISLSMTNGVDRAFLKYNCDKLDESGELFKKNTAQLEKYKFIAMIVAMLIGMFISKYSLRLTIGVSIIPYVVGGILALFITNIGGKIKVVHTNILKDMWHNVSEIMKTKQIKWYVIAYILTKEITHPIIWVFTPLMILVGVPVHMVAIGWILNYVFATIGTHIAMKTINLKFSTKFILPMIVCMTWMTILVIDVNIVTIWLFAFNGLAMGITSSSIIPSIQEKTKDELQATIVSIASTASRLFYVPLVYGLNLIANDEPQMALIGNMVIFFPLMLITYLQLMKMERKQIG